MNYHLKQFLNGILILIGMIVYWIFVGLIPRFFVGFYNDYKSTLFYSQIIFSFFLFLTLIFYCYKKSIIKSVLIIFLISLPYLIFLLLMQFAQINIPRLIDVVLLFLGIFLIYIIIKLRSHLMQIAILVVFCIILVPLYPVAFDNAWYIINNNKLSQNNALGEFNLKIRNRNGITFNLSDFQGKTICVDMWSSSCGSCIATMPDFEFLNKKFKDDKDYKIISLYCPVNKEQTYEWFKNYMDRKFVYDIEYYYIDYESFNKLNIRQFPEFLIINKNNDLVYRGQISYLSYVHDNIYSKLKSINENF